ncbi:hypothetical protein ABXK61_13360 [Burkholderia sola]|uniref:hypothetical protein n=1 Tax=Burkholderia TaxID=32008 RepID=UPI001AE8C2ED|nr:hypothetical protein [Burkholderia sp. AcTa6-5]MBP0714301.1 hypothetical protein [Burkholderia sp. AcTa6-5]
MIEYNDQYYENYFRENYNASLLRGCGADECLDWASHAFQAGDWLDVGAGPCSFFWASAAPTNLSSIVLADRSIKALHITSQLAQTRDWPAGYREAAEYLGRSAQHLDLLSRVPLAAIAFDAFSEWPPMQRFHSISAFGLLGLAQVDDEVRVFLVNAKRYLARGGILFGASWVFSPAYAERLGGRKQCLTGLRDQLSSLGFEDVDISTVPLANQDDYIGIVLFRGRG